MTEEELKVYYTEILDFWKLAKQMFQADIHTDAAWDRAIAECRAFGENKKHRDFCEYLALAVLDEIDRREKAK